MDESGSILQSFSRIRLLAPQQAFSSYSCFMNTILFLLLAGCGKSEPATEPPEVSVPTSNGVTVVEPALGSDVEEPAIEERGCVEECVESNMASPLPADRIHHDCESACAGEAGLLDGEL